MGLISQKRERDGKKRDRREGEGRKERCPILTNEEWGMEEKDKGRRRGRGAGKGSRVPPGLVDTFML